jgi:pimeloyl-ACP methyl ester carboxylesterase
VLEFAVKAIAVVALALLALTAYLYVTQRGQLYFPWPDPVGEAPAGVEAIELVTDDDLRLGAWFLPAIDAGDEPGSAVLVCNGNAGSRAHRLPLAQALSERGHHVLLFDYRGYAGNPGSPTEEGLRADARAAARALAERPEVDPARIAYFGESLGAAVCTGLASERPPAALILRSPFPSTVEAARHHYPYLPVVDPLVWDRWPLARQLADEVRVDLEGHA